RAFDRRNGRDRGHQRGGSQGAAAPGALATARIAGALFCDANTRVHEFGCASTELEQDDAWNTTTVMTFLARCPPTSMARSTPPFALRSSATCRRAPTAAPWSTP